MAANDIFQTKLQVEVEEVEIRGNTAKQCHKHKCIQLICSTVIDQFTAIIQKHKFKATGFEGEKLTEYKQ